MQKKVICVDWMHCNACKILIEKSINEINNVDDVKANVRKWTVEISYKKEPDFKEIKKVIEENWYKVSKERVQKSRFSNNKKDYLIFFCSLIWFIALYYIIRKYWLISSGFSTEQWEITFSFAALIWLIAWFSSCMAIVWWLVLAISSKRNNENEDKPFVKKFIPHIWFNLWRIVGFWILWWILWLLGWILKLSPIFLSIMTLIVGIILILLWLNLTKISPKFDTLFALPTWKLFQKWSEKISEKNRIIYAICWWLLTFFLPCWFTFSMQLYALSTWDIQTWAIIMIAFAIWTLPWLLWIGIISSIFTWKVAKIFYQIIGVLVILLWIYNISNVWWNIEWLLTNNELSQEQAIETINMVYTNKWLEPSSITVELWKTYQIIIDSKTTIYWCMSTITLPWLDNSIKEIKNWDQIIFEFTPTKKWTFGFNCAMWVPHNAEIIVK